MLVGAISGRQQVLTCRRSANPKITCSEILDAHVIHYGIDQSFLDLLNSLKAHHSTGLALEVIEEPGKGHKLLTTAFLFPLDIPI